MFYLYSSIYSIVNSKHKYRGTHCFRQMSIWLRYPCRVRRVSCAYAVTCPGLSLCIHSDSPYDVLFVCSGPLNSNRYVARCYKKRFYFTASSLLLLTDILLTISSKNVLFNFDQIMLVCTIDYLNKITNYIKLTFDQI